MGRGRHQRAMIEHNPPEPLPVTETTADAPPVEYAGAVARRAKAASARLGRLPGSVRNQALSAMADSLDANLDEILTA
ncbi:MAG: hypothetical protein E8D45_08490, partial [Nitrospira sp.]